MKIGVLGTGSVGRALAGALADAGHEVSVGTRDVAEVLSNNQEFGAWHAARPGVPVVPFAEAASGADLVVNGTAGTASVAALGTVGAQALAGMVVMDVANPLDFSAGFPPSLSVAGDDSLAEQIQRAFPDALVVKALNTLTSSVMVAPGEVADGDHDVFVCGNDAAAKATVIRLLQDDLGWRSVLDLGDITAARGLEMYLPLWLRIMDVVGSPRFNIRVVR